MAAATTTKPSRSQFIEKLHELLENPVYPDALRWISDDAFEISAVDTLAREALSPKWEFRSLSSFIRQLSYYNYKRLSDRRRSSERRASSTGYIVFTHPSGCFVRGKPDLIGGVVRKTRARPEKTNHGARRASIVSTGSNSDGMEGHHPMLPYPPQWTAPDFRPQYLIDGQRRQLPSFQPSFQSTYSPAAQRSGDVSTWRSYTPGGVTNWTTARRSSIPDFKLASPLGLSSQAGGDERPRLRKAASALSIQTINNHNDDHPSEYSHDSFRSPYPTPTFSPAYGSTYFPSMDGPAQQQQSQQPQLPPLHSHLYETYHPPSQQHQQHHHHKSNNLPSPTSSHSDTNSPQQTPYAPLPGAVDPRQLASPRASFSGELPGIGSYSDNNGNNSTSSHPNGPPTTMAPWQPSPVRVAY